MMCMNFEIGMYVFKQDDVFICVQCVGVWVCMCLCMCVCVCVGECAGIMFTSGQVRERGVLCCVYVCLFVCVCVRERDTAYITVCML